MQKNIILASLQIIILIKVQDRNKREVSLGYQYLTYLDMYIKLQFYINTMSQTYVKIRFGEPQQQTDTSKIQLTIHLQKHQTEKIYQAISKATRKYKTPFIVVQTPESFRQFNLELASKILQHEINFQTTVNQNKAYHLYEPNDLQIIAPLRKIQNLLQKLNTLNNTFFINLTLCNLDATIQKKTGLEWKLLQHLFVEAKVDLDKNFVKLGSQLLAKISPGFDQSPIVGFLQLFGGADVDLQFQSPSVLSNATREGVLQNPLKLRQPQADKQGQILKSMLKDIQIMKIYLNFGKLGCIQLTAESRVWAFMTLIL